MLVSPFLKWAGGKRWLAPKIRAFLDWPVKARLVEPFLGSAATFFCLQPRRSLLADTNSELIASFRAVRDYPDEVIRGLGLLKISKSTFEAIRDSTPRCDVSRAVRLIYLNRTAFNGLYRVNREGKFNVPFGCKKRTQLCDAEALRIASRRLRRTVLRCQDFRKTLGSVDPGRDFIYVDPPYTVRHDNNGFKRYNGHIFTWFDQEELAAQLIGLAKEGGNIIISNANHREIKDLYPSEFFHAFVVTRATCMAARSESRGSCSELVIISRAICESPRRGKHLLGLETE